MLGCRSKLSFKGLNGAMSTARCGDHVFAPVGPITATQYNDMDPYDSLADAMRSGWHYVDGSWRCPDCVRALQPSTCTTTQAKPAREMVSVLDELPRMPFIMFNSIVPEEKVYHGALVDDLISRQHAVFDVKRHKGYLIAEKYREELGGGISALTTLALPED